MIADIECIPQPLGTPESKYAHVEAAIAVVQESGLKHEVNAMSTSIEGTPEEVWALLRRVHEATIESGAEHVVTIVKLAQDANPDADPTIDGLTGKFRS